MMRRWTSQMNWSGQVTPLEATMPVAGVALAVVALLAMALVA